LFKVLVSFLILRKTDGFVIVFDVNDSESINYLKKISKQINISSKPTILIGNFNLETEREITKEKCENIAKTIFEGAKYFELNLENSKSTHVDVPIVELAKKIMVSRINSGGGKRRSSSLLGRFVSIPDSESSDNLQ
jgi:hypothetical protein